VLRLCHARFLRSLRDAADIRAGHRGRGARHAHELTARQCDHEVVGPRQCISLHERRVVDRFARLRLIALIVFSTEPCRRSRRARRIIEA
jgi:hypothetical protein